MSGLFTPWLRIVRPFALLFLVTILGIASTAAEGVVRIEVRADGRASSLSSDGGSFLRLGTVNDLQAALDRIGRNQSEPKSVEVEFAAGIHRISLPLWLSRARHPFVSITFSGPASGPIARIVGTQEFLVPSSKENNSLTSIPLTQEQLNNYFGALYGYGKPIRPHLVQLFANGRRITPERWPADSEAEIVAVSEQEDHFLVTLSTPAGTLDNWPEVTPGSVARLNGYFARDYAFESVPCTIVGKMKISVSKNGLIYGIKLGGRVDIENILGFNDLPSVFVHRGAREARVIAKSGTVVELPVSTGFLRADGMKNLAVKNLELFGYTGDALVLTGVEDVALTKLSIRGIGGRAMAVDGHRVTIRDSQLDDLGEGGISLSGGGRIDLSRGDNNVYNTKISHFDVLARSYRPAVQIEGVGNSVINSVLSDGNHSAIIFAGNDHIIANNFIARVTRDVRDSGAIYAGRDWTTYGTVIKNNIFEDIHNILPAPIIRNGLEAYATKGIYLDDGISGITIHENVFINTPWAVFINGGKDNDVEHNIFIESVPPVFASALLMYLADRYLSPTWRMQTILSDLADAKSKLVERHPALWKERFSLEILKPTGNTIANNIFLNSGNVAYYKLKDQSYFSAHDNTQLKLNQSQIEALKAQIDQPHISYEAIRSALCEIVSGCALRAQ